MEAHILYKIIHIMNQFGIPLFSLSSVCWSNLVFARYWEWNMLKVQECSARALRKWWMRN